MTLICQAVDTTRDLIACHDSDTRYDEIPCRSAVAALYLPIIGLVIGALQQLYGYGSEDNSSFTPDVAMAIATSSITTLMGSDENKGELASQVNNKQFLMTFLSMLRTMKMSVSATADNTYRDLDYSGYHETSDLNTVPIRWLTSVFQSVLL